MPETPSSFIPQRVQFSLVGRSRAYDPTRQAIRSDLADVTEAEHHFSPHYALPASWVTLRETALRDHNSGDAPVRALLPVGARFALLDLTGDWGWGYVEEGHVVGYVAHDAIAPFDAT